jgi:phosphoribosylformylglycinamidine synthase subunit PurQ / glutaminase
MRVAVVLFPGMNCESETVRALASVGIDAEIVRANEAARLASFAGYVLPGGFSYEDRIRAGAVAARHPAMAALARASEAGKPLAGICNGAQILLEAGLVPGIRPGRVEMALALNDSGKRVGYYCDWRWVTGDLFDEPVPLPFAHAEGRFVSADEVVRREVLQRGLVCARYCDASGEVVVGWPVNPNGAWENAAAMRNREGNVVAIMPHPERACWAWQVPPDVSPRWAEAKRRGGEGFREAPGPGRAFFERFRGLLRRAAA